MCLLQKYVKVERKPAAAALAAAKQSNPISTNMSASCACPGSFKFASPCCVSFVDACRLVLTERESQSRQMQTMSPVCQYVSHQITNLHQRNAQIPQTSRCCHGQDAAASLQMYAHRRQRPSREHSRPQSSQALQKSIKHLFLRENPTMMSCSQLRTT